MLSKATRKGRIVILKIDINKFEHMLFKRFAKIAFLASAILVPYVWDQDLWKHPRYPYVLLGIVAFVFWDEISGTLKKFQKKHKKHGEDKTK